MSPVKEPPHPDIYTPTHIISPHDTSTIHHTRQIQTWIHQQTGIHLLGELQTQTTLQHMPTNPCTGLHQLYVVLYNLHHSSKQIPHPFLHHNNPAVCGPCTLLAILIVPDSGWYIAVPALVCVVFAEPSVKM